MTSSFTPAELESRVPVLMGVLIGMGTAATIAVTGRFIARGLLSRNLGWDDWTMLIAVIFSILTTITGSLAASYGMGRHIKTLTPSQIRAGIKAVWYARMFSQTAFGFVKLSIALLYWRIFSISRTFSYFLYGTIGFNFVVTTIWMVMTIKCIPVSANWDLSQVATAKCIQDHVTVEYAFFAGVAHSLLDVTYVVLPLIFIWNLRLPKQDQIALTFLLGLGLFAAICSMIKISKTEQLGKTQDITWEFTDLSIWNVVELNVGIIVGSVPPMRPLLVRIYRHTSDTLGLSSVGAGMSGSNSNSRNRNEAGRRSSYVMQVDERPFELRQRDREGGVVTEGSTMGGNGDSKESILESKGSSVVAQERGVL